MSYVGKTQMPMQNHTNHNVVSNGVTTPRVTMMDAFKAVMGMPKAFIKSVTGRDEFSKQVGREYKKK